MQCNENDEFSLPTLASQPLLVESVQQGPTMIAKCWTGVSLVAESVFGVVILKLGRTKLSKPSDEISVLSHCRKVTEKKNRPSTNVSSSLLSEPEVTCKKCPTKIHYCISLVNGGP